jgi:hypothetical protein
MAPGKESAEIVMASNLQCELPRTRPCLTCARLSLQAKQSRRTAFDDELWHIEARRTVAILAALIRVAESVLDRFAPSNDYDGEEKLKQAIECAGTDLERRCREPDAFYAWVHGEEVIDALANAIAIRIGESPRQQWPTAQLGYLGGRALRA